jgi:3-phenylpropionate/trans-cinnamate dioxygenase ferredoxin reductase subunit
MAVPWLWSDQHVLSLQITDNLADGPEIVRRRMGEQSFVMFLRIDEGRLVGASGIGPGNSIARDVKLAEMLIAKWAAPPAAQLADPSVQLKTRLRA